MVSDQTELGRREREGSGTDGSLGGKVSQHLGHDFMLGATEREIFF
jgi:hypothetical protein